MATTPKKKTASTPGVKKGTKNTAKYPVSAVSEIAEELPRSGNRARYEKLMGPLVEDVGQTYLLGVFTSTGGARRVANQMRKGKTAVPGGVVENWEITAIKTMVDDPANEGEQTEGSHLYVKYLGE